ncbi:conserved hypothetical protein, proteobacterial [Thioflavicoccus mobilis 8321]|uniref:Uncharacterized protein n=1 Tax=Thioflavicoccus mobilis 8321 TaxID=765912 RepID=L0GUK4_9GAMM|nr:TorF family putative porin [Thioflavicoccus mobilis]AGA88974.1 conserved hypothetical protein, proteobacterial [Thioflavicoccus mobilis 8321]
MIARPSISACATPFLLAASFIATVPASADAPFSLSANIGAVSNYLWRGMTQTDDGPAIQGGIDLSHESGFYAGTWASNIDWDDDDSPNYELDLYMGYDFTLPIENASLGINTIYYAYPDGDTDVDFWEIGISGGYQYLSAGIQYTVWGDDDNDGGPYSEGDLYYYAGLDLPLPKNFALSAKLGYYDFDDDEIDVSTCSGSWFSCWLSPPAADLKSADYWHWGVSVSREAGDFGTFSFNYEQNDGGEDGDVWDDDAKVWVGWNKEF